MMLRNPYRVLPVLLVVTYVFPAAVAKETLPPAAAEEPLPPDVVATVNGEPILLEDLEVHLARVHGEAGETSRSEFSVDRLLFKMTNDLLLAQEARALGMETEPPTVDQVRRYREKLMLEALERDEILDHIEPTDEEVQALYHEQYRRVTLRVITRYEKAEAEGILEELRDGADMAASAKERSQDPYAMREGLVKDLPRIDIQRDIAEAAFASEPGELVGPIRTDLGWSVIRVENFQPADPETFEEVRRSVARLVRYEKGSARKEALAVEARNNHPVTVNEVEVARIVPERLADARLAPQVPDPEVVIARIGETRTILAGRYGAALLSRWSSMRNIEAARVSAPIVLQKMLEEELLLAEADRRDYDEREDIRNAVRRRENQFLVPRYLAEVVASGIETTPEEMKAYFEENRETYRKPPRVHLSQITVATEDEAERIAGLLREGSDVAWLARKHSTDRFRDLGGDRGWVAVRPGADEVSIKMAEAEPGEVLGPIGVEGNYVVLVVSARQEQGLYAYEEVSGNIRQAVEAQKFEAALDEFMDTLRGRAEIRLNQEVMASLSFAGAKEGAGGDHGDHQH